MLRKRILNLLNKSKIASMNEIIKEMNVSERTIRSNLEELRLDGEKYGFEIKSVYGRGYRLKIYNDTRFQTYYNNLNNNYELNPQLRYYMIIAVLLQKDDYITIIKLSEQIGVSESTVKNDLDEVKEKLVSQGLELKSKPGFGIKIIGDEKDFRVAFSKYVVKSRHYTAITKEYNNFKENIKLSKDLEQSILDILREYEIKVTKKFKDSLFEHLSILLFRISNNEHSIENNMFIKDENLVMFMECAEKIVALLERTYSIYISEKEIYYLAIQIAGRSSIGHNSSKNEQKIIKRVNDILNTLDQENHTSFRFDSLLIDSIVSHMGPLIIRNHYRIELKNPLIDLVDSKYAVLFLITMRFFELWNQDEKEQLVLSRDEVGYLAFHFAGNLERTSAKAINSYHRIMIVTNSARGETLFIRQKIQNNFPKAVVNVGSYLTNEEIVNNKPDLIISSERLDNLHMDIPIYYFENFLTDNDLNALKDYMVISRLENNHSQQKQGIERLFNKEFFLITDDINYLKLINNLAYTMVEMNLAESSFPALVIEREKKYTTIYEKGIAGPHALNMVAIKESIGVIIPRNEIIYENKTVKLILLINLQRGSLFTYREISNLIHYLINNDSLTEEITHVNSFDEFLKIIKDLKF